MAFRTQAIQEALWPEALGVGTYGVGMIVGASIDAAMREQQTYDFPLAQNLVTGGSLVGGVLGIGYNKAPGFCRGLMYGAAVGIVLRALQTLWEAARREPARARASDVAALIPRRVGAGGAPAGKTGAGAGAQGFRLSKQNLALQPAREIPRVTVGDVHVQPTVASARGRL